MRIKTRVRAAMAAQAAIEGRFLGGRPPYGYQLVDAGPHPNPAKAADRPAAPPARARSARRAGRAADLRRVRSTGTGLHRSPRASTATASRRPSAHDPGRNRHRADGPGKWAKSAVRAILANPRYTGFEVWNKQRKDEVLIDVEDVALGHETKMRWNDQRPSGSWSSRTAHEPLVSRELFDAAQAHVRRQQAGRRTRTPTQRPPLRARRADALRRVRAADARPAGTTAGPTTAASSPRTTPTSTGEHPRNIYVREDALVPGLDGWLAALFDDDHIDDTCDRARRRLRARPGRSGTRGRAAARRSPTATASSPTTAPCSTTKTPSTVAAVVDRRDPTRAQARSSANSASTIPGDKLTAEQVKALVKALAGHRRRARRRRHQPTRPSSTTSSASHSPTTPTARVTVEARPRVGTGTCRRGDLNPHEH